MGAKPRERQVGLSPPGADSPRWHRLLKPPYGYAVGVGLWPVFLSILAVWAVLLQSGLPPIVATVGGAVVGIGGFVMTSVGSTLVMAVTAWNTPSERIHRDLALLVLFLPLAGLLVSLYLNGSAARLGFETEMSAFVAHELSKIVVLGPAIGFAYITVPLGVLVYRSQRQELRSSSP